jgi:preprotein translocase subunit SecA
MNDATHCPPPSHPPPHAGRGTDILLGGNPDYMARLKLREMLMPAVVSQTSLDDDAYSRSRGGQPRVRSFAADPSLFPCEVRRCT